ncbi:glycosyltransferase [Calothrix sp. 336/3]|uniref:glycosyltransferase n=1 Tax=Calothrix sp. 336/3 TaxID=1337936 RepID=UPI0004E301FC|nr:glycosyltransferase [Calothrix sp. 336/3]AKG22030.1 glycosyl transferase family 1 [Calothrix sp. 336/3]
MGETSPQIAIFLRSLIGGGAEKINVNLANYFAENNLKVDLVLGTADGIFLPLVSPQVRIVDLQTPKLAATLPKLVKYLRQEKPLNLLASLHYPCEIAIWAKHLARVSTRVIVCEHNTLSQEAKRLPQLTARLTPLAARFFYPWADDIITVSQEVAQDLAQVTGIPLEKIHKIYNPVITPDIGGMASQPIEHPWFCSGEVPIILGMGRLMPQKDFPTLIKAFHAVRQVQPARLVILGNGTERSPLNSLIQELDIAEDVELMNFQINPYPYMKKAAVFALSSAWEGCPNVLTEAMAVGTPVVSTNCPSGPAEILDKGKYGHLVPVGDHQAMAKSILQVLAGQHLSPPSTWLEQFSLATSATHYLKVLKLAS